MVHNHSTGLKEPTMTIHTTPSTHRRIRLAVGTALALTALTGTAAVLTPAAGAAPASGLTYGHCTKGHVVSMQLQHGDPGRIEAGFEVDHAKVGSLWRVAVAHNGVRYYSGIQKALAPDGTFSVDRILLDRAGTDTVTGYAHNVASGEVCTVTARI
jgi:hypothetical protein